MATDAQNAATGLSNLLIEWAAITDPLYIRKPNYTVDGKTYDWVGYKTWLMNAIKEARENVAAAEGPSETVIQGYM